jgi:hypothetical protein
MSFLDDILNKVKANTLDKTNLDEKLVGGVKQAASNLSAWAKPQVRNDYVRNVVSPAISRAGQTVASLPQKTGNYFQPTSNKGNNFWQSPTAKLMARVQSLTTDPQAAGKAGNWLRTNANAQADFAESKGAPGYIPKMVRFMGDYGGNAAQTYLGGIIQGGTGLSKVIDPKSSLGDRVQGAVQTAYGAGRSVAATTPVFGTANLIASTPRNQIKDKDIFRRLAAGTVKGMSGQDLAQNVPDVKTDLGPLGEADLVKGAGSMYGFVQNPTNKAIFGNTQILEKAKWFSNPITNFLATRSVKGGVEGFLQGLGDMPDNLSQQDKAKFVMNEVLMGVGSEVAMDALMKGGGKALDRVWNGPKSQQALAQAYDYIRDAQGRFAQVTDRLRFPGLPDNDIDFIKQFNAKPTSQHTKEEILRARGLMDKINATKLDMQSGKIDPGAKVDIGKGENVRPGGAGEVSEVRLPLNQTGKPLPEVPTGTADSAAKPSTPIFPESSKPDTRLTTETPPPSGRRLDTILSEPQSAKSPSTNIIQEAKSEIGGVPTKPDKPLKQQLRDFYTNWVNRFQPLEDVATRIESDLGASILPEKNPAYTTRRLLGAGGVAEYRHQKVLQPILGELGDIPSSDFDVFLKAKRDLNLGQRGIKGSDSAKAQQVIDALASQYDLSKMDSVAGKLYAYQDEGLNMLREAGLISNDAFARIKNTSENYVPFQRVMDEVDNYLGLPTKKGYVGTSPVQKIKGSDRQILSPVESIIANTYKIESAVSRNRVAQSLVNLRQVAPQYADMFEKVSKDSADAIAVWENGKKNFYRVGEDIARSIKGLNEESVGILTKILSAPAQLLRQGATGRNPDFMIPNVFKDQFDAAISSKHGYKPFVDYFRGLSHLLTYKRTGSDELVEEWMKSGGSIFFENMGGRKQLSEQIMDATTKKGVLRQLKDWAIGGIDAIGELSETPTRLGLYQRAKEATGNQWLAMMESREGTLDFARMGAKMKVFNSIIPFLNVDVQGFDKLIRSAKDHPGKMALNMTLYAGLPQLMVSAYNNTFYGDEYAKVPQWEKDTNFIVVTGKSKDGKPQYLKIPKGNILPLIANPTDALVSYLAGNDKQSFGQFAMSLLTSNLPVLEGGTNLQEVFTKTLGSNLPQAIKPVFENAFNKSTFYTDEQGKPQDIVPYYMENKPPSEQFKKSTPDAYKALGKILNVSPLKAQNFLEGYLSGFIKTPTNITQILKDVSEGKNVDPNKVPILRRFYGEREDFYTSSTSKTEDSRFAASAAEPNFVQRLFKQGVKEEAVQQLPTDSKDLGIIYHEARKDFDAYEEKKLKIDYGNYEEWEKQSKLQALDKEYQFAKEMVERIEREQPEAVLKMTLDLHASSGSKTVEERAGWATQELSKATDQKQFDALIDQMLEAKVLTKSVAEALREQGIPIDRYTEGGKIKTLGGSGSSKTSKALKDILDERSKLTRAMVSSPAKTGTKSLKSFLKASTSTPKTSTAISDILAKRRKEATKLPDLK